MALTESRSFPGAPVATPVGPSVTLGSHREVNPRTLAFYSFQNSAARGTTQSGSSGSSFGDLDGFLPSAKCLSAYQLGVTCFWKVEVCVLLVSPRKPGPQFYTIQLNSGGVTFVLASPRRWVNSCYSATAAASWRVAPYNGSGWERGALLEIFSCPSSDAQEMLTGGAKASRSRERQRQSRVKTGGRLRTSLRARPGEGRWDQRSRARVTDLIGKQNTILQMWHVNFSSEIFWGFPQYMDQL